jgi:hypothetical protein
VDHVPWCFPNAGRIQAIHLHHQMDDFVLPEAICYRKCQENMTVITEWNLRLVDSIYSLSSAHRIGMGRSLVASLQTGKFWRLTY